MDKRVTEFAAAEAKARFSELLDRAEAGEEITIRRHGRAVARLAPMRPATSTADRRKGWSDWLAYRQQRKISLPKNISVADLLTDTRG